MLLQYSAAYHKQASEDYIAAHCIRLWMTSCSIDEASWPSKGARRINEVSYALRSLTSCVRERVSKLLPFRGGWLEVVALADSKIELTVVSIRAASSGQGERRGGRGGVAVA